MPTIGESTLWPAGTFAAAGASATAAA
ncbi:hypothetical protein VCCP104417_0323, partial [Vibrio cholerae CP1044(17)]